MKPGEHRRRGVALIFTLLIIALLALLVAGLAETLRVRLVEVESLRQRASLRAAADSAIETIRARLARFPIAAGRILLNRADLQNIALDPLDGFVPRDGSTVSVKIRDESGLYALNSRYVPTLRNLFHDAGVEADRAETLAETLADWTDEDDNARARGAESDDYGESRLPANRMVRSFFDLREIRGFAAEFFNDDGTPNEAGARLAAIVSYLDISLGPNLNGAPDAVVDALSRNTTFDEGALRSHLKPLRYPDDRLHTGVFNSTGELSRIRPSLELISRVKLGARNIRLIVTVSKGDLRHVVDVLLGSGDGKDNPVVVARRLDGALMADAGSDYLEGVTHPEARDDTAER